MEGVELTAFITFEYALDERQIQDLVDRFHELIERELVAEGLPVHDYEISYQPT